MLAAAALAGLADRVVVVERDVLPTGPVPRKGLPQARHVHQLWSGGAVALEELLPGVTGRLRAAGAHRLPVTTDMVALSPQGWFRRWAESHFMLLSSRDLLDATVRAQVLTDERIELLEGAEVLGLDGTGAAVTGVRVRVAGAERALRADLVIDATGRASRTPHWLAELGLPAPAAVPWTPASPTPAASSALPRPPATVSPSSTSSSTRVPVRDAAACCCRSRTDSGW